MRATWSLFWRHRTSTKEEKRSLNRSSLRFCTFIPLAYTPTTMKLSIFMLGTMAGVCPVSAFSPPQGRPQNVQSLQAVDTAMAVDPTYVIAGVGAAVSAIGGAAIAFGRKGGESIAAKKSPAAIVKPEVIDLSVPYDAAATLAYNAYTKTFSTKVDFEQFRSLYYEQMVAEVKAAVQERKVNEMKSVLADLENDASTIKCKIDALFGRSSEVSETPSNPAKIDAAPATLVNESDVSIDYNGAAKLAYASSDKSMDFESFRKVYEAETVAMVSEKNPYKK